MKWFILACIAVFGLLGVSWVAVRDLGAMEASVSRSINESTQRITAQVEALPQIISDSEKDIVSLTDRQLSGITGQLDSNIKDSAAAVLQVSMDTRKETLARVDAGLSEIHSIRDVVNTALNGKEGIVWSVANLSISGGALADTYRALPGQISQDRIFKAYEAQGLGVLGATKVFMGDAAKAGRTFDAQFPILLSNITDTTGSFTHVASHYDRVLTGPTSVRGKIAEWGKLLVTGANTYSHVK